VGLESYEIVNDSRSPAVGGREAVGGEARRWDCRRKGGGDGWNQHDIVDDNRRHMMVSETKM
jgi:hypothetical protein